MTAIPHVNRLMEGFAFLAARVKQQIDMGVSHVGEALVRQLAPQYLSSYPATAIVKFHGQYRGESCVTVPSHYPLISSAVGKEKTVCRFQTVNKIHCIPYSIAGVSSAALSSGVQGLRIDFQYEGHLSVDKITNDPAIYINAPKLIAAKWLYFFLQQTTAVSLYKNEHLIETLPNVRCSLAHDLLKHSMRPAQCRSSLSSELLMDYFQCRERFYFMRIHHLFDHIPPATSFSILLHSDTLLPDSRIAHDLLLLNCVPSVNLFEHQVEPVRFTNNKTYFPMIVQQYKSDSYQMHSIESVYVMQTHQFKKTKLSECFQHEAPENEPYYRWQYLPDGTSRSKPVIYLHHIEEGSHCSIDAMVSNGDYPRRFISTNHLFLNKNTAFLGIDATNITKPTPHYQPQLSAHYINQIVMCLNVRLQSFLSPDTLKQYICLHDWTEQGNAQINAIEAIQLTPSNQLAQGVMKRVLRIEVTIDQAIMPEEAEVYLLGLILHRLFYFYAPLNTSIETVCHLSPSMQQFKLSDKDVGE